MTLEQAVDTLCVFLARRDDISRRKFDAVFAFGCEILEVVEAAVAAYTRKLAPVLVFSGGVGHGTLGLRRNACEKFGINTEDLPEADIMARTAMSMGVPASNIIIENKSTNSGENAMFSLKLLECLKIPNDNILLIQDPLMQLRSHLTMVKYSPGNIFSCAPFVPSFAGEKTHPHWLKERFFELLTREIPRLRNDGNGYGPNGRDFIAHCDIPKDILDCYEVVKGHSKKAYESI